MYKGICGSNDLFKESIMIETREDYLKALKVFEELLDGEPKKNTRDYNKLQKVSKDIDDYEKEHFVFDTKETYI
jgi:antitoxin component HigA of HigAB toxin-antitoxin module